jgi:tetratricopeptide (TPR) repeat protein
MIFLRRRILMRNKLCGSLMLISIIIILISFSCISTQKKQGELRDVQFYNNRGIAYGNKGEYDQAISDFNKAIEISPRYADPYNNRGVSYSRKGKNDEAISDYSKAIEIDPKFVKAYHNRAWEYTLKGQYDRAISDLNKALEINPRDADTHNNLAWNMRSALDTGQSPKHFRLWILDFALC